MYVFLLILGAVIAAAGIVLVAAGVPIQGHDFDASVITPGAVAIVGGLILVGLGLAVRALGRIEQALAARPGSHSAHPADVAAASEPESPSALIASPPKPTPEPNLQPAPPAAAASRASAEDAAVGRQREKFPSLVRLDSTAMVEQTEASSLPMPPVRADEDIREFSQAAGAKQAMGAAPAKTVTRLDRSVRSVSRPERTRSFETFWPKGERPGQEAPMAPAPPAAPAAEVEPVLPAVPAQSTEPAPDLVAHDSPPEPPTPVSVLKSGSVDGMAYTLYSDGSIEAQLPQGTLRFGSIADLRSHIEQSA